MAYCAFTRKAASSTVIKISCIPFKFSIVFDIFQIIGQYSTGKSTFLKYILGEDYPGINIGPEPTTDKFTVIMHGPDKRIRPGNAVVLVKNQ